MHETAGLVPNGKTIVALQPYSSLSALYLFYCRNETAHDRCANVKRHYGEHILKLQRALATHAQVQEMGPKMLADRNVCFDFGGQAQGHTVLGAASYIDTIVSIVEHVPLPCLVMLNEIAAVLLRINHMKSTTP